MRSKLEKLVNPAEIDEAVVIEHEELGQIDLDEELGSLDEEYDDEEYDD